MIWGFLTEPQHTRPSTGPSKKNGILPGVAMTFNMQAYRDTKDLFESSHDGIIQGVPFAGLPVLTSLCTMHQMREVSFYYAKLRPLLTELTNADTPSASQKAADLVAEEVVELVDPLYYAMVEAVSWWISQGCSWYSHHVPRLLGHPFAVTRLAVVKKHRESTPLAQAIEDK